MAVQDVLKQHGYIGNGISLIFEKFVFSTGFLHIEKPPILHSTTIFIILGVGVCK